VGDIIVAAAASSSLTGATIFKGYVGEKVLTALLLISTVTAIVKPLLKLNKKIASAAKLQRDYLCLYQKPSQEGHSAFGAVFAQVRNEVQPAA
jgi:hypothetical protein